MNSVPIHLKLFTKVNVAKKRSKAAEKLPGQFTDRAVRPWSPLPHPTGACHSPPASNSKIRSGVSAYCIISCEMIMPIFFLLSSSELYICFCSENPAGGNSAGTRAKWGALCATATNWKSANAVFNYSLSMILICHDIHDRHWWQEWHPLKISLHCATPLLRQQDKFYCNGSFKMHMTGEL